MGTSSHRSKRVVITRSREGNRKLGEKLLEIGIEPIPVDVLTFLPPVDWSSVDSALTDLHRFDWLVFTSTTGVEFFVERMRTLRLSIPWKGAPRVAAIGESTTRSLLDMGGIQTSFVPSSSLTASLGAELPNDEGRVVLLLRADIASPDLPRILQERGFSVCDHTIYRTAPGFGSEPMHLEGADSIIFASPSAVDGFCRLVVGNEADGCGDAMEVMRRKPVFCLGPITARAAKQNGFREIILPSKPTLDCLLEELVDKLEELRC
jgi:uroporphyrinogen-III synthase